MKPEELHKTSGTDKAFPEWWMLMEVRYLNRKDGSTLTKGEWIEKYVMDLKQSK